MKIKLYTVWLPISIVAHVMILFVALSVVRYIDRQNIIKGVGQVYVIQIYTPKPDEQPNPEIMPLDEINQTEPMKQKEKIIPPDTRDSRRPNTTKGSPTAKIKSNNSGSGPINPKAKNNDPLDNGPGTYTEKAVAPDIVTGANNRKTGVGEQGGRGTNTDGVTGKTPGPGQGGDGPSRGASVSNLKIPGSTKDAANTGYNGSISVRIAINSSGKVTSASIISGNGGTSLNNTVLSAARNTTFNPKIINGENVNSSATITYKYVNGSLNGSPNVSIN